MRRLAGWRMVIPPAAVPLALWMFVAMAGPGGIVEVGGSDEPDATGGVSTGINVPANGDDLEDSTSSDGDATAVESGADLDGGSEGDDSDVDGGTPEDTVAENAGDARGCEWALTDRAESRGRLDGHVADEDKAANGADGNQNALDRQCGGAFADESE